MKNKVLSLVLAISMFLSSLLGVIEVNAAPINTSKTMAYPLQIPKVAIASLDHVPFVEGDNNEFYISAKNYTGTVQYKLFYIQESIMKEWKLINNPNMANGWTNPIDAQSPIKVDITGLNLKADKYRFAIRIKRAGIPGLKQNSYGDYDDVYPFNLDVVKSSSIKLNNNLNIKKTDFSRFENLIINGVGNETNTQYKLHLFDVKNNKWLTNLTEYSNNINYDLKNTPEGTYIVDLWAKNNQSKNKYDGWKLKIININNKIVEDTTPSVEPVIEPVDVEVKEIINAYKIDTDGDGLTDFQEINKYSTDPNKKDTDGDGINDGDWEERKDNVYTLTAVMELRKPYNIESMNDDYQDARIISENNNIAKVEIIMYPYNTINKNIIGNKNWQNIDDDLVKYTKPGITSNWDDKLREDIITDMKKERNMSILYNTTDLEVVRSVSDWAYNRSIFLNEKFPVDFAVSFDTDNKPYISSRFQYMVDYGNPKSYEWDNNKLYSNFILGKDMYYNKSHGSCSSYSVYQSTILKAIGIPTRTILSVPCLNGSSEEQKQIIKDNITNKEIANNITSSLKEGITDHFINEVYINGRWIRLNYAHLGSNTYDRDNGFYLAVHIDKEIDYSDFHMDKTWTDRMAVINRPGPDAQSYNLISIKEQFAK